MRSHAMESSHPSLESAVVGVDVLHVINLGNHPDTRRQIDFVVGNPHLPGGCNQCLAAVGAKDGIRGQNGLEGRANVRLIRFLKNEVGGASGTVTADQHRNLFVGQASFRRFPAALAWCTFHAFLLPLERFKEECLVRFGNTDQVCRLLLIGQRKKTMTPAEGGVAVHVAGLGAFANALPFGHLLRVRQPFVLVPQPGQRRPRQGIEGGLAGRAPIALQARRRPPARDLVMTAFRARWRQQYATLNHGLNRLYVSDFSQTLRQQRPLVGRQPIQFFGQRLKFFRFHRKTYLTDYYRYSIDHYLTVT